jgi:2-succinyl-5-enolpyruvyl-6-hydroxy-3-cyclohexene-1-carboxylate synthase
MGQMSFASDNNDARLQVPVISPVSSSVSFSPFFKDNKSLSYNIDGLSRPSTPSQLLQEKNRRKIESEKQVTVKEIRSMIAVVVASDHKDLNESGVVRLTQMVKFVVAGDRKASVENMEAIYLHLLRQQKVCSWDLHYMRKAINELKK